MADVTCPVHIHPSLSLLITKIGTQKGKQTANRDTRHSLTIDGYAVGVQDGLDISLSSVKAVRMILCISRKGSAAETLAPDSEPTDCWIACLRRFRRTWRFHCTGSNLNSRNHLKNSCKYLTRLGRHGIHLLLVPGCHQRAPLARSST